MTRVVNIHYEPCDVLICRPSKWGNPFEITDKCPRELAVAKYEVHIRRRPDLIAALPELAGKRLGCHCKQPDQDVPCHGDVLVRLLAEFFSL
jgi:hypothetical protein